MQGKIAAYSVYQGAVKLYFYGSLVCTVQSLTTQVSKCSYTYTYINQETMRSLVPNEKVVRRNANTRVRADECSSESSLEPRLYEKPYELSLCRISFSAGGGGGGRGVIFVNFRHMCTTPTVGERVDTWQCASSLVCVCYQRVPFAFRLWQYYNTSLAFHTSSLL